jgi:hypothetical protein
VGEVKVIRTYCEDGASIVWEEEREGKEGEREREREEGRE